MIIILYFIKTNYLLFLALLLVGVLYFILSIIFKNNKKTQTNEEEYLQPKISNRKIGYIKHNNSYSTDNYYYNYLPKDGTNINKTLYNKKIRINNYTKNYKKITELRYDKYSELFYIRKLDSVNKIGKNMKLSNNQVLKDLKFYNKNGKFKDFKVDIKTLKITYIDDLLNKNEEIFYTDYNETKESKKQDNDMSIYSCPYCQTENIIDKTTIKINCYYCLKEIEIQRN